MGKHVFFGGDVISLFCLAGKHRILRPTCCMSKRWEAMTSCSIDCLPGRGGFAANAGWTEGGGGGVGDERVRIGGEGGEHGRVDSPQVLCKARLQVGTPQALKFQTPDPQTLKFRNPKPKPQTLNRHGSSDGPDPMFAHPDPHNIPRRSNSPPSRPLKRQACAFSCAAQPETARFASGTPRVSRP